ncbi:hypothetical protein [Paraburkholderia rhynchosiae]|uniref:Uncharacterized protein n=1 Tax=Paraburkholderia rhynchosiae TaxID=487049 RepID=A0A2N7WDK4_9BURK|nr:hypothetical protein [Paraburkholderia rhynchosiae]PMS27510.1 hypothetical protein C0Z16_25025 [Paraburkholderia rhynchosiae]CAB3723457.1 hypothetical protein LMG27174_05153 [Paraburkholderia rhynchosiae]
MLKTQGSLPLDTAAQVDAWLDSAPGRIATAVLGFVFIGWIAYGLHSDPRWHWHAGTGKLPGDIVHEFMEEAYTQGKGVDAYKTYFSDKAIDTAPHTIDHEDGAPIPDQVKKVIVEGMDVAVYHTIGATRDQPAQDVVDIFELSGSGWIIRRDRIASVAAQQSAH